MKVIHVLGTAPTIYNYKNTLKDDTIGVNDIYKQYRCKYLLVLDNISTFNAPRLSTIVTSRPKKFYSSLDEWSFMPNFEKITMAEKGGDLSTLDDFTRIPKHVDSTFSACCLAYHLGAKWIKIYGVTFYGHHLMEYSDKILSCYSVLKKEFNKRGIVLSIDSDTSLLAKVLPLHNNLTIKHCTHA